MLQLVPFLSAVLLVFSISQITCKPDEEGFSGLPGNGMIANGLTKEQITKCLDEVGMTMEEMRERRKNPSENFTENQYCLGRCFGKASGAINPDGSLNTDFIKTHLAPKLANDAETIIECMEKVKPISACLDIKTAMDCFPKHAKGPN